MSNFLYPCFLVVKVRNLPLDELEFASLRGFVQKVTLLYKNRVYYDFKFLLASPLAHLNQSFFTYLYLALFC
jgi:hypothetical protein